VPRQLSNV